MRHILFPGTTFLKKLHYFGRKSRASGDFATEVTCTLIRQEAKNRWDEDETHLGILLQYRDPDNDCLREEFNGHAVTLDPMRWFRAIWFLEAMPDIDNTLFHCDLYWGAGQITDEGPSIFQRAASELRQAVGDRHYREIMARPLPKAAIDLLITLADAGHDVDSALYAVSDEIAAGTIRWSQELRRIGVKHPDYWRASKAAKAEIVLRYKPYLFAYAAHRKSLYTRDHQQKGMMIAVEWGMVAWVERDIEKQHGADITALLGILKAEIETDALREDLEKRYPHRREGLTPFTPPSPEQRFRETVTWFLQSFTTEPISGRVIQTSHEDYLNTLQRLYHSFERLPVVSPLGESSPALKDCVSTE